MPPISLKQLNLLAWNKVSSPLARILLCGKTQDTWQRKTPLSMLFHFPLFKGYACRALVNVCCRFAYLENIEQPHLVLRSTYKKNWQLWGLFYISKKVFNFDQKQRSVQFWPKKKEVFNFISKPVNRPSQLVRRHKTIIITQIIQVQS